MEVSSNLKYIPQSGRWLSITVRPTICGLYQIVIANANQILFNFKLVAFFLLIKYNCTSQTGYFEGQITYQDKCWNIALEFVTDRTGKSLVYCDFLEISAYRREFEMNSIGNKVVLLRKQPSPRVDLKFDGIYSQGTYSGTFDGIGIKEAGFIVKSAKKVEVKSYDLGWANGDVKIAGTLLTPVGKGPYTTVIFTHGSNPETRETYYGTAMKFVEQGIACLIYDKRGVGKSVGGDYRASGFTDFASDALAGLKLIKNRSDIDSKRIGIFGHSQGGWIAPVAAGMSKDIGFVLVSAASPVNAAEQSVYHRMQVMKRAGFDSIVINKAACLRENLNRATKLCADQNNNSKSKRQEAIDAIEAVKSEPWFEAAALPLGLSVDCPGASIMELLFSEPADMWAKVKVPVYLAWGDADEVVPFQKKQIIKNALANAGNKNATEKIWPDVDHSIFVINKKGEWDFPRECKGYFDEMIRWVKNMYQK